MGLIQACLQPEEKNATGVHFHRPADKMDVCEAVQTGLEHARPSVHKAVWVEEPVGTPARAHITLLQLLQVPNRHSS